MFQIKQWLRSLSVIFLGLIFASSQFMLTPTPTRASAASKIVFTSESAGSFNVASISPDGSGYQLLTDDAISNIPSITPNGQTIFFMKGVDEEPDFYTMGADGSNLANIELSAQFASVLNNSKIVSVDLDVMYHVANIDGSNSISTGYTRLQMESLANPSFSDVNKFAYVEFVGGIPAVFSANLDGSNEQQLSASAFAAAPTITKNGNKVYFVGTESPEEQPFYVYSANSDGTNLQQLFETTSGPYGLSLSPDESKLLFYLTGDNGGTIDVYTIDIDGSNPAQILDEVNAESYTLTGISWSPDSSQLTFSQSVDDTEDIFVINADGTGLTNITNTPDTKEMIFYTNRAWGGGVDEGGPSEGVDGDSDGIADIIEDAGPNGGDANDDGTLDSEQAHVTSIVNPKTGQYSVLAVDEECSIDSLEIVSENQIGSSDATFNYPTGLMDFRINCGEAGFEASVIQYHYGVTGDLMLRKFTPTEGFFTIDSALVTQQNNAGSAAIVATYKITDGGRLDLDGEANGSIEDPAGLALRSNEALAQTGANAELLSYLAILLMLIGITTGYRRILHNVSS